MMCCLASNIYNLTAEITPRSTENYEVYLLTVVTGLSVMQILLSSIYCFASTYFSATLGELRFLYFSDEIAHLFFGCGQRPRQNYPFGPMCLLCRRKALFHDFRSGLISAESFSEPPEMMVSAERQDKRRLLAVDHFRLCRPKRQNICPPSAVHPPEL